MTDFRQFGDRASRSLDCGRCEAMLADAVDGMLSPEEQQFFDAHVSDCSPCVQLLAEARRGAAWLEMLRTPAPEPPPALLEKILVQTSGTALHAAPMAQSAPAMAPGYTNVLPFPRRAAAAMRAGGFGRLVFEPRLAMTAAMAFVSIALTLDLMGVNPLALRAGDLSPSSVMRSFSEMHTRAAQYYEGLRVVYELESRVHDFENVQENARDAAPAAENQQQPAAQAPDANPQPSDGDQQDQTAPEQNQPAPQAQPKGQQQPDGKSSVEPKGVPNAGIGRHGVDRKGSSGTIAIFPHNANRPAVSDAELDEKLNEYYSGISSAIYADPLFRNSNERHERRAA